MAEARLVDCRCGGVRWETAEVCPRCVLGPLPSDAVLQARERRPLRQLSREERRRLIEEFMRKQRGP